MTYIALLVLGGIGWLFAPQLIATSYAMGVGMLLVLLFAVKTEKPGGK